MTKLRIGDANTMMAEGGIQAADKENDSPQRHYLDAFGGGHFAAKPELLYIPQDGAPDRPTVAAQIGDAESLYSEVKRLIAFRQSHAALRNDGEIEFLPSDNYPLMYIRKNGDEKLLVVINPSDRKQPLSGTVKPGGALYTIGGKMEGAEGGFSVAPCSAGIYRL